jgi:E3 ubiquitin-protein ligase BRE1
VLIFITHAHDAQAFRKEAIYREMLSYKRQLARAQSETEKLRSQRLAYQVRVSRVEQEWRALIAEANLRLPSTSTSSTLDATGDEGAGADSDSLELDVDVDAILLGASDEDLDEVLARRSTATKALLERLQSLQPAATTQAPSELEQRCAELGAQALAAREHLRILRAEHAETVDRLEETHARLVRVERKFDRMQSRTVAELEGRPDPAMAAQAVSATASGSGVAAERRGSGTPGVAAEGGRGSPLVAANGATSTSVAPQAGSSGGAGPDADDAAAAAAEASREIESLRDAVKRRGNEIEELRSERVALKNEIDQLKVKVRQ